MKKQMNMIEPAAPKAINYIGKPIKKTPVNIDSIEGMTPETDKYVTGVFKNIEYPGQPARICARLYKGMQPFNETMEDGKEYRIPLSVARHINTNCAYPVHNYVLDESGSPVKNTGRWIHRYAFNSKEFS